MTDAGWETLSNQAVAAAGLVYFLALLVYLWQWASLRQPAASRTAAAEGDVLVDTGPTSDSTTGGTRAAKLSRIGVILTAGAAVAHLVSLFARGAAADPNRVPWSNMYEFVLAGSFVLIVMFLAVRIRYDLDWMAPLVVGLVVALLMVAVIWLHAPVTPLSDALDSPWLVIHVVSAIIATGAFTLGGLLSAVYLVKERKGSSGSGLIARAPSLEVLDRTSYRIHAFAFPVWTFAVLITGPIWAHEAWARYWNWDPKEVWAFITWVVYAAYLHARATAGWKGRNAAYLALLGTATLWFNFIGINYFSSSSMHSYAEPAPVVERTSLVELSSLVELVET